LFEFDKEFIIPLRLLLLLLLFFRLPRPWIKSVADSSIGSDISGTVDNVGKACRLFYPFGSAGLFGLFDITDLESSDLFRIFTNQV